MWLGPRVQMRLRVSVVEDTVVATRRAFIRDGSRGFHPRLNSDVAKAAKNRTPLTKQREDETLHLAK